MSDRRVLITGASRGIGLELVKQHLASGDQVVASCRNRDKATALSALAESSGARLDVVAPDVADPASIARAAVEVEASCGALDLLWSNAGIYPGSPGTEVQEQPFGELTMEEGLEVLRVNAVGALMVAQAFWPMLTRGRDPKLAVVSSGYGSVGDNHGTPFWYGASKAALNMLHRSLAFDPAGRGVVVLLLSPGWTATDMGGPRAPDPLVPVVEGLRQVVERATAVDTGAFLDWRGEAVPF